MDDFSAISSWDAWKQRDDTAEDRTPAMAPRPDCQVCGRTASVFGTETGVFMAHCRACWRDREIAKREDADREKATRERGPEGANAMTPKTLTEPRLAVEVPQDRMKPYQSPLLAGMEEAADTLDAVLDLAKNDPHGAMNRIRIELARAALKLDATALRELWAEHVFDQIENTSTWTGNEGTFCEVCRAEAHEASCPVMNLRKCADAAFTMEGTR